LIYEESQNINGAIEILKRLIEVNPYSDHSITKLANICDEHNKNAEALDVFKNAIKLRLQHEDWYLYFRVGYLYNDME
jgi:tetratricopeptide (TPR) repeat protein